MRALMVLALLLGGLALGQDDLGVELEMLEPDLDYLLETLEAVSCLCSCEDWCSGGCAGASSCGDLCTCPVADSGEPEPAAGSPGEEAPAERGEDAAPAERRDAPAEHRSAVVPFAESSVFSGFGLVTVPTCVCIWQLADGTACSADASWPAGPDGVCECSGQAPGCDGDATAISVLLVPPDKNLRRR